MIVTTPLKLSTIQKKRMSTYDGVTNKKFKSVKYYRTINKQSN